MLVFHFHLPNALGCGCGRFITANLVGAKTIALVVLQLKCSSDSVAKITGSCICSQFFFDSV